MSATGRRASGSRGDGARGLRALVSCAAALAALAAPAAAMAAGPLDWSASVRADNQAPFTTPWGTNQVSCPSSSLCVAGGPDQEVLTTTTPGSATEAWAHTPLPGIEFNLDGLSCPSVSLCVATATDADAHSAAIVVSTNPTGGTGAWSVAALPSGVPDSSGAISCPTVTFCAAIDDSDVLTSTNPTGGSGAWQGAALPSNELRSISCATSALCVAVDFQGNVFTSTNPTGGAAAWVQTNNDATFSEISCPTAGLCVAVAGGSGVFVSTDPTAGAASYTATLIPAAEGLEKVSCRADGLCVGLDQFGAVAVSTDPTGGTDAWHVETVSPPTLYGVSCPSDSLCVAVGWKNLAVSSDPTGPADAWRVGVLDGANSVTSVSCPTASLCVGVDDAGNVLWSTDPSAGDVPWPSAKIDNAPLRAVSCVGAELCVATDDAGNVVTSNNPTGGPGAWSTAAVDSGNPIRYVSCVAGPVCVALDDAGNGLTSTDPAGGAGAWNVGGVITPNSNDSNGFTGDSCATAKLCIVTTQDGKAIVVTNPGGATFWKADQVVEGALAGVSCPTATFCAAPNGSDILTTTDPQGGPGTWRRQQDASLNQLTGITCSSTSLCVAWSFGGDAVQSATPQGRYASNPQPADTWSYAEPVSEGPADVTAGACASDQFCVLSGAGSNVWIGTAPGFQPPAGGGGSTGAGGSTGGDGGSIAAGSGGGVPASPASTGTSAPSATPPAPSLKTSTGGGATATARPLAAVRVGTIRVGRERRGVNAPLSCPRANAPSACEGRLTLLLHMPLRAGPRASQTASHTRVLAVTSYRLAAGRAQTLTLALRPAAARSLRQAGRWSTLELVVTSLKAATSRRLTLLRAL